MAETKIMYFNESSDGWWAYKLPSGKLWSAPQHLKVEVDLKKSKSGSRYYFKVLEGPWVIPAIHYKQYQTAAKVYAQGSIGKKAGVKDTLVDKNPHTTRAQLTVKYKSHDFTSVGHLALPVAHGQLTYAGVTKDIVMTGDLIVANAAHPISIPDEKHSHPKYEGTDFHAMWFRIDAQTAGKNFTGGGKAGDRYFHLGSASAGCFTNIFSSGNDHSWNKIANTLSKARVGSNQLYVGDITFSIPPKTYVKIKEDLIAYAKREKLTHYVWENQTLATP